MSNGTFIGVHLALWAALGTGALLRVGQWADEAQMPPIRSEPLTVEPEYDYEVVVTDDQLQRVLEKLKPPFQGEETKINHMDHALRFWTVEAKFDPQNKATLSGEQMRRLLTDYRLFTKLYGEDAVSLLKDEPTGIGTRVQEGHTTSSHVDHTVACLAEAGTPLDYPVYSPTRAATYRDLVEHTFRSFSLNQIEYEWSALTFALFQPARNWRTTEGQEMSFDRLAERIMREKLPLGVCFGNHRLHTLTMFLRVDDQQSILSPAARASVEAFLLEQTATLVKHQHPDGFWDGQWPNRPATDEEDESDNVPDRILATGHALEWWALAPQHLHPPRPVLASAGQWLVREIDSLTDEETLQYYTYLTHAGRALALWRSKSPATVVRFQAEEDATPAPEVHE